LALLKRIAIVIPLAALLLFVQAGFALAQTGGSSVTISDFQFTPATLQVAQGTTVTWTNNGPTNHTTTSDSGAWDSGALQAGKSFSFKFNTPGTFAYHCSIHPSMKGTITVAAASSSPAAAPTAAAATSPSPSTNPAAASPSPSTSPAASSPSPSAPPAAPATSVAAASPSPAPASPRATVAAVPTQLPKTGEGGGSTGAPTTLLVGLGALVAAGCLTGATLWKRRQAAAKAEK